MKKSQVLALAIAFLLVIASTAALAQQEQVEEEITYANPEILVDTEWVLENLDNEDVVFIQLSSVDDFLLGHIPGARQSSVAALNNPDDEVTGQIGTPEQVAAALEALGITSETIIVLYDGSNNLSAARAYWVLKYYQHADVRIYNGGLTRWLLDGQELATEPVEFEATEYEIAEADEEIRTTGEYVLERLNDDDVQLCDTRGINEYIGTDVRADRGGHIPGAINLEWINAVNTETGEFLPYEELDELFVLAGFNREKQIITYCQTGVRGAHTWFVLRELLGYPDVRNYDGSWVEWGNNIDNPIGN